MKIIHDETDVSIKRAVGTLEPGAVVLNGCGNLCLVVKDPTLDSFGKTRVVLLETGQNYTVNNTCQYEVVDATLVWKRKCA